MGIRFDALGYGPRMSSLLRAIFLRRAARFLPGGWFALILLNPRTRAFVRSQWAKRRGRGPAGPPPV